VLDLDTSAQPQGRGADGLNKPPVFTRGEHLISDDRVLKERPRDWGRAEEEARGTAHPGSSCGRRRRRIPQLLDLDRVAAAESSPFGRGDARSAEPRNERQPIQTQDSVTRGSHDRESGLPGGKAP
jgi:hypothetical protein